MSQLHPLYAVLQSNAWIQVYKPLMFALGNDEAIIFGELLSRQVNFEAKGKLTPDGYFFNTFWDLASGVNLSDHEQRRALKNLKAVGLVDVKVQDVPPKRFFRIENRPMLLANIIKFGLENMERVKQRLNFQYFQKSILSNIEFPYNKNHQTSRPENFNPKDETLLKDFDPELAQEIHLLTPAFEGMKEQREDEFRANGGRKRQRLEPKKAANLDSSLA